MTAIPDWYKDAIIYELHVRTFCDSDADGIGDFKGLISRLDYLQELGVTALWLLPFYPSPLKDEGYDIADYKDIHPTYGTLDDFKLFMKEAHQRNLKVITELVINHTSDEHPWFKRARRANATPEERNFYVWSDTARKYSDARIIFQDYENSNWTWDHSASQYYWHRFYSHQPDLNFENPNVCKAIFDVLDFWMSLGVDGMRLDAIPYLYEEEGTSCENLSKTHVFLKELRHHIDKKFPNRMLLAEANQWPEDSARYFGQGDECNMAFHFPIMPRLFMSIHMEDRFPIIDILEQTPEIPESCQWALFLRNHDELTLEMVTDEERDYMYRVYANDPKARVNLGIRRRLAPLLGNNRRKIELMNALLFSLLGTPVLYYGDELGMGDNIYLGDRNSVRTPMQWSADKNAGFSKANPQQLYLPVIIDPEYHYETVNVEAQQSNLHSLYWWMKRMINLRKNCPAFGRGRIQFLHPENRKVLCFIREFNGERILVVNNLSRFVQYVQLDLSDFNGYRPVELLGSIDFPKIGELPYFLTLGPHGFYWFHLIEPESSKDQKKNLEYKPKTIAIEEFAQLFKGVAKKEFQEALKSLLPLQRWFSGKNRRLKNVDIFEAIPVHQYFWTQIRAEFSEGEAQYYNVAFSLVPHSLQAQQAAWAQIEINKNGRKETLYLIDAFRSPEFFLHLAEIILKKKKISVPSGHLTGRWLDKTVQKDKLKESDIHFLKAEQSNTSVIIANQWVLKVYRKFEDGINPDYEISYFLTRQKSFPHTPKLLGALQWQDSKRKQTILCKAEQFLPNQGDAWNFILDTLGMFFEKVLALEKRKERQESSIEELLYHSLNAAELLAKRTAEMHLELFKAEEDPEFAAERFTPFYQRSYYQSLRNLTHNVFQDLEKKLRGMTSENKSIVENILKLKSQILKLFGSLTTEKLTATRIRIHGDYHLGQVLYTGKDFVIIDFEGEPLRPLSERRVKRCPLRDVAGMLRSFHYAAYTRLTQSVQSGFVSAEQIGELDQWAELWYKKVSDRFVEAYQAKLNGSGLLPATQAEINFLLEIFLLEKALYEVDYESRFRPDWIKTPIKGIASILSSKRKT